MARRKQGVYQLLEDTLDDYRKHMEFQNMLMEVGREMVRFPIPDIRRCKRLTTDLSDYCHCQLKGDETVENLSGEWFIIGVALVNDACSFLDELIEAPRGVVNVPSMPTEVRETYDLFMAGEIDISTALGRLALMQPVLEQRGRRWWSP